MVLLLSQLDTDSSGLGVGPVRSGWLQVSFLMVVVFSKDDDVSVVVSMDRDLPAGSERALRMGHWSLTGGERV